MTRISFATIIGIAIVASGCHKGDSNSQSVKSDVQQSIHETLVFIDKSSSVSFIDSSKQKLCNEVIEQQILELYSRNGDRLIVFYIHSDTRNAKPVLISKFDLSEDCSNLSKIKKTVCQNKYKTSVAKRRASLSQSLVQELTTRPNNASKNGTDIFGVLEVASTYFDYDSSIRSIYIFSDMIQSTNERELNQNNLISKEVAIALAKKDKGEVDSRLTLSSKLTDSNVYIIAPDESSKPINFKSELKVYWKEFFNGYKMKMNSRW